MPAFAEREFGEQGSGERSRKDLPGSSAGASAEGSERPAVFARLVLSIDWIAMDFARAAAGVPIHRRTRPSG